MLTAQRLRQVLAYDASTGVFTWLVRPGGRKKAGDVAGSNDGRGYVSIVIDRIPYKAHRLAWLYMTGEAPPKDIDHINLNRSDNSWANLRLADRSENRWNQGRPKNNRSGFKGVFWNRAESRWQAGIKVHGRTKYLGLFDTPEEAHAAYVAAAEDLHGQFARVA